MKKIAFFVEGQTEQIFVSRLVKEILGYSNVSILMKKISGGSNIPKRSSMQAYKTSKNFSYLVLIYDCGADNRVKSEILDNIESLRENEYSYIIGLRDLYPMNLDELGLLEKGQEFLPARMKIYKPYFDIVIAVREIETWFLAETDHFQKVDQRLSGEFIEQHLGFNPYKIDPILRTHPAEDLDKIYKLVGKSYNKKYWQIEKIVNKLDITRMRQEIRKKISSLNELITFVENLKYLG